MVQPANGWDEIVDVVVVGSGGAALTAAVTASDGGAHVLVVEKADVIGGTTGVSGGVMWVPGNHHLAASGLSDSRQEAIDYVSRIADGRELDPALIEVFVDTVPEMLEYLEANTPLRTQIVTTLPDYYSPILDRIPGCKPFSRCVEPLPYPAREALGDHADRVAARADLRSLGAATTLVEDVTGADPAELARRERAGMRVKGAALICCLLKGLLDRGVEVRTSSPAQELIVDADRAVVGVRVGHPGDARAIGARRGVILACGGFEWNRDMVLGYLGYDVKPISPGGNTGDGHLMAMEAGAKMGNMTSFWGQGAMIDPAITGADGQPAPQMSMGLGAGSIIVNQQGHRFMHGGLTYNDFPKPFANFDQRHPGLPNKPPAWVIFGPSVKDAKPILTVRPGDPAPDWMVQAGSIGELADRIGVDPSVLEQTVATYHGYVADGFDPEWGDPTQTHRLLTGYDTTLAPVDGPPYYAIQQWPGTLGTNGGCRIDANAQVLGNRVDVVPGLYAAGNTSASVLGGAYVGGGTPIACGATFGFIAGRHAAAQPDRDIG
ncbi:MAG: FAD-dependent oxidoreductase [Ilumatobacteraceae bacterium]